MDTFEFDSDFYDCSRTIFNTSEDISFFSNNSPPSSPRPCPISPCRSGSMSSLSMENEYFDFNSPVAKERKPSTPARKKLNMDIFANEDLSKSVMQIERNHLQNIDNIVSPIRMTSSGAFKRSEYFEDSQSPTNTKRHRSENFEPASPSILTTSNLRIDRQYRIMKVLTSSSHMLRKNRL